MLHVPLLLLTREGHVHFIANVDSLKRILNMYTGIVDGRIETALKFHICTKENAGNLNEFTENIT